MSSTTQVKLSEQEWLQKALEVLSDKGPEYLSLRRLTSILGVTTGSFYWHFPSRKVFLRRLVEHWGETSTTGIAARVAELEGSPEQRLYQLMLFVFDLDATRHDAVMRSWATRQPELALLVEQVEQFRLDYIRELFSQMGFKGRELTTRAHLCLAYMSSHRVILDGISLQRRREHLRAALALLTKNPST